MTQVFSHNVVVEVSRRHDVLFLRCVLPRLIIVRVGQVSQLVDCDMVDSACAVGIVLDRQQLQLHWKPWNELNLMLYCRARSRECH